MYSQKPMQSSLSNDELSKMCRSCSKQNVKKLSIHTKLIVNSEILTIQEMIEYCTTLKVGVENDFPSSICQPCMHELVNAYSFIRKFKNTDEILKQYITDGNRLFITKIQHQDNTQKTIILIDKPQGEIEETIENVISSTNDSDGIEYKYVATSTEPETSIIDKIDSIINKNDEIVAKPKIESRSISKTSAVKPRNKIANILKRIKKDAEPPEEIRVTFDILDVKTLSEDPLANIEGVNIQENSNNTIHIDHDYIDKKKKGPERTKQCEHCLIYFLIEDYEEHVKKHVDDVTYECEVCKDTFGKVHQLHKHHKVHFKEKEYRCEKCDLTFNMRKDYIEHAETHREMPCPICLKVFNNKVDVEIHKKIHLGIVPTELTCELCDKTFFQRKYFNAHIKRIHNMSGGKKHICKHCSKAFLWLSQLKKHERTHSVVRKLFKCELCNKELKTKEGLDYHKELHILRKTNTLKKYPCDQCDKKFTFQKYLMLHKRRRHTESDPLMIHLCSVCGKECNSASQLKLHETTHSEARKMFKCEICDKQLLSIGSLKKHHVIFHGNKTKNFLCNFCPKKFMFKEKLEEHVRRHKGDFSHFCTACDKKFYAARELKMHMRVHTGERPYECPHCTASFMRCQTLNEHIRTHTGDLFECQSCWKTFTRNHQFKRHIKICKGRPANSQEGKEDVDDEDVADGEEVADEEDEIEYL